MIRTLSFLRRAALPLAAALALACSAPPKPTPPPAKATELGPDTRDFDQIDLALDLDLDMDRGALSGTATIAMASLRDGLDKVRLHLEDMKVESVTANGILCASTQSDGILTIALDRPRAKDEKFTLAIRYGGVPRAGLWFFKPTPDHPEIPLQVWSQGEGKDNRHWIPVYDLPDDRFTTSLRVTVPAGLQTLSNGEFKGTEALPGGRVAHRWALDRPQVSYLITLVAGTFDDVTRDAAGIEEHDLVPPGWGKRADDIFGRTPDMMAFFQDYTGEKYAWGKRYSQVTVWDFLFGGMENSSATTLNMRSLHEAGVRPDYTADPLVAHELAHDWFGDLITCRTFNHSWLNEGFATFFTDLWIEHHEGREAYDVQMQEERDDYMNGVDLKTTADAPRPAKKTDCGDLEKHAYVKGASILHMLRGLLGDDAFRRGIRRYVADQRDKSVETEALRAAMEAESKQDLAWFFDQWVYRSGFPEIAVSSRYSAQDHAVHVDVEEEQPVTANMPLFRVPVDIDLVNEGAPPSRQHVEITGKAHEFVFPADREPDLVLFDPGRFVLARILESKPLAAWQAAITKDPTSSGRVLAARALAGFGAAAVPALAAASTHDARFEVRAEAATALGKIKSDDAANALVQAAEDKDSRVRKAAVAAMADHRAELVGEALKKHLADDPSVYVAAEAAAALGKTKAPGAFEALSAGLARESHRDQIRQRIMDGLKALGDPRGAELARRYLDYSWGKGTQHFLRQAALDAMVTLAPDAPETKDHVLKLLRDPFFRMKQWSARHAAKLKIPEALAILRDVAENGTGPGVQETAKSAADEIAKSLPPVAAAKTPAEADAARAEARAKADRLRKELDAVEKEIAAQPH